MGGGWVGGLAGWLNGWVVGWLVGWVVGWCVCGWVGVRCVCVCLRAVYVVLAALQVARLMASRSMT